MKLVRVYTNIVVLNEMRSRTDGPALGIEGYSVADVTSQHIGPSLQALPKPRSALPRLSKMPQASSMPFSNQNLGRNDSSRVVRRDQELRLQHHRSEEWGWGLRLPKR